MASLDEETLPDAPRPEDAQNAEDNEAAAPNGLGDAKQEVDEEAVPLKEESKEDEGSNAKESNAGNTEEKLEVKLEDMFTDDEDGKKDGDIDVDEEDFPDSEGVQIPDPSADPPIPQVDAESMSIFYQRLFPFKYLFRWLNHGIKPSTDFGNREFAFTLSNDAYLRYQSYHTGDMLHKDVMRLNPSRFEIGPVYNTNPRDRKSLSKPSAFKPVTKELVFDIDLTDYDDIRTCCSKANICLKCWSFVTMSIKVIDAALRDDFGFDHILWVYSGRRGAHAWVCDKKARDLPDDRRRALAGYLEVVRGGSKGGKRIDLNRPLHPHIARSLEILKPYFTSTILTDQDSFSKSSQSSRLLELLPDKTLRETLQADWEAAPDRSSTDKWADIDTVAQSSSCSVDGKDLLEAKQDIVLEYTYPRLDAEVSKKLIHLLKSPFVVHPGTGRVCVPIDIENVDEFNPLETPTLPGILAELNAWNSSPQEGPQDDVPMSDSASGQDDADTRTKRLQDYEKTSLKPYIDYFRSFVSQLNNDEQPVKRERADDTSDAMEF